MVSSTLKSKTSDTTTPRHGSAPRSQFSVEGELDCLGIFRCTDDVLEFPVRKNAIVPEGECPDDDNDRSKEACEHIWDEEPSRAISIAIDVFPVGDISCSIVSKRCQPGDLQAHLGTLEVRRNSYVRRSLCIMPTVKLKLNSSIRTPNVRFFARSLSCCLCAEKFA
jgi:hypothetical protein